VAISFGAKEQGHLRSLENFQGFLVDFCTVWGWLGSNRNYFLETEGPAAILPMRGDRDTFNKNLKGLFTKGKEYGVSQI
jgi:hypothetical protein